MATDVDFPRDRGNLQTEDFNLDRVLIEEPNGQLIIPGIPNVELAIDEITISPAGLKNVRVEDSGGKVILPAHHFETPGGVRVASLANSARFRGRMGMGLRVIGTAGSPATVVSVYGRALRLEPRNVLFDEQFDGIANKSELTVKPSLWTKIITAGNNIFDVDFASGFTGHAAIMRSFTGPAGFTGYSAPFVAPINGLTQTWVYHQEFEVKSNAGLDQGPSGGENSVDISNGVEDTVGFTNTSVAFFFYKGTVSGAFKIWDKDHAATLLFDNAFSLDTKHLMTVRGDLSGAFEVFIDDVSVVTGTLFAGQESMSHIQLYTYNPGADAISGSILYDKMAIART